MIVFTIEINANDGTIEKHSTLYDILNSAEMIGGKNIDRQIWKEFLRLQQKLNASYSVLCVANIYQALISTHIMTLTYLEEKRDQLTTNITVEKPQKKTKIYAPDKKRRITSHIGQQTAKKLSENYQALYATPHPNGMCEDTTGTTSQVKLYILLLIKINEKISTQQTKQQNEP